MRNKKIKEPLEPFTIKGFLQCDKLVSTNRRLIHSRKGMHDVLSKECKLEKLQLEKSLENSGLERGCLNNSRLYSVMLIFYLKENLLKRDLDNLVKTVVDVISAYCQFNDNRIISYQIAKRLIGGTPDQKQSAEWVYFEIEASAKSVTDITISLEELKLV